MATFTTGTRAVADVYAPRERIWEVLTDPALVARLTPFVRSIEQSERDGATYWYWTMTGLDLAGRTVSPSFTERMTLHEPDRIEFTHEPPTGARDGEAPTSGRERAGVHGWYDLSDGPDGSTRLETSMEICLDAPIPRIAAPVVKGTMQRVMSTMGDKFSQNFLDHLGADQRS